MQKTNIHANGMLVYMQQQITEATERVKDNEAR